MIALFKRLALALVFVFASLWIWEGRADAYVWMIRHDYAGCVQCHADPSGGSLLLPYGRGTGHALLHTRYGGGNPEEEDPGKLPNFLFGAADLPDWLLLGADFRGAFLRTYPKDTDGSGRFIMMQSDLEGEVRVDRFRVNGSIGYVPDGAAAASLTKGNTDRVVSRAHWLGFDLGEERQFLVRAGRFNIPFGLRIIEHTAFVRSITRTDINASQQHGASFALNVKGVRAEIMGIAGNFQLAPDALRDRGYAGYVEITPTETLGVGVSSMITHADRALSGPTAEWRHAHGPFARFAPAKWLALLAEGDFIMASHPSPAKSQSGLTTFLQADVEPVQGLHLILQQELLDRDMSNDPFSWSAGTGVHWFFGPRFDARVDMNWTGVRQSGAKTDVQTVLAQFHFYL